jgi:hypothetical protein
MGKTACCNMAIDKSLKGLWNVTTSPGVEEPRHGTSRLERSWKEKLFR